MQKSYVDFSQNLFCILHQVHLLAFLLISKDASASRQDMQTSVADLPVSSANFLGPWCRDCCELQVFYGGAVSKGSRWECSEC